MTQIRFYEVDTDCFFSRAVHFLGRLVGYDMDLVHVTLEWDGFVSDFTIDGIGYYSVEEDEQYRIPAVKVEVDIDKALLYERSMILAYTNLKLTPWALIKKMLGIPMSPSDWLCTDYVQLLLGLEPNHYSAKELLDELISGSIVFTENNQN